MWMVREAPRHPIEAALRRAEHERDRDRARLLRTYRTVGAACWEFNLVTNQIDWSDELYDLFSIDRSLRPNPELIYAAIHPDDLERTIRSFEEALELASTADIWQAEYRLHPSAGSRWIRAKAFIE